MKGEDCKVPIREDQKTFLDKPKVAISGGKKTAVIATLLLLIAMLSMTVFTFQSLNGINELRQEVENLKTSIKLLQKKIDEIDDDQENPKNTSSTSGDEYFDDVFNGYRDDLDADYGSNYDDYDSDDVYSYDEVTGNTVPLTADRFTKDAKTATAPPRSKRSILGYDEDTSINSEADNEIKRRNSTLIKNVSTAPPPSSYSYPFYQDIRHQEQTTPGPKHLHSKRLHVHQNDNLQTGRTVVAPLLKSGLVQNSEEHSDGSFTVVDDEQVRGGHTRHRQRRIVPGRMRPLPTAHFSGDTSKYVLGYHENFRGNGHLRHPQRTFVDWAEKSWFRNLGMERYYSFSDGYLTIKDAGLYFIYAQIFYHDAHDVCGFRVYRNENETLLQCTTTSHSSGSDLKSNTCFTAAAEYLNENDRISLEDLQSRYSLFEPGKSFFGIIQLGDFKIK